jgi:hypothetical protein
MALPLPLCRARRVARSANGIHPVRTLPVRFDPHRGSEVNTYKKYRTLSVKNQQIYALGKIKSGMLFFAVIEQRAALQCVACMA